MRERRTTFVLTEASSSKATHFYHVGTEEIEGKKQHSIINTSWYRLVQFLRHWRNNLLHLLGAIAVGKATGCTEERQADELAACQLCCGEEAPTGSTTSLESPLKVLAFRSREEKRGGWFVPEPFQGWLRSSHTCECCCGRTGWELKGNR